MIPKGLFITSTGTEIGKTYVTRGLARALQARGIRVAAIKPIETGCDPDPLDAVALANACGIPELARDADLYRAGPALAPYAVSLKTGLRSPDMDSLVARVVALSQSHGADITLVEGAGGLLAPLDKQLTMAELASALALPALVVAHDALGVISHTLTLFESAALRHLPVAALVLVRHEPGAFDTGPGSNRDILAERLEVPVFYFPFCKDDDDELGRAAESSGLMELAPIASR
jgi:dethiobiotin synthetase